MVWPSGGDLARYSMPIAVPAPGLYSTITGLPHIVCKYWANTRAWTSIEPPGGVGKMMVTVLVGNSSAPATFGEATTRMPASSAAARSSRELKGSGLLRMGEEGMAL